MPKQKVVRSEKGLGISLAVARILLGFIFLWAFFDKLLGLGFATPPERSWLQGGSPTAGFLGGVDGTFATFFNSLSGNAWVDWLFMLGLLGVGIGLVFGVAMRLSIIFGSIMLLLMWLATLPLSANPLIDDHIVYIATLVVLWFALPMQQIGFGRMWRALPVVANNFWLQ